MIGLAVEKNFGAGLKPGIILGMTRIDIDGISQLQMWRQQCCRWCCEGLISTVHPVHPLRLASRPMTSRYAVSRPMASIEGDSIKSSDK